MDVLFLMIVSVYILSILSVTIIPLFSHLVYFKSVVSTANNF